MVSLRTSSVVFASETLPYGIVVFLDFMARMGSPVETILAGKSLVASLRHLAEASLAIIISLILSVRLKMASSTL